MVLDFGSHQIIPECFLSYPSSAKLFFLSVVWLLRNNEARIPYHKIPYYPTIPYHTMAKMPYYKNETMLWEESKQSSVGVLTGQTNQHRIWHWLFSGTKLRAS